MERNEVILKLIECENFLYHIEGNSFLDELDGDMQTYVKDNIDLPEIADKLGLLARIMFCGHYDTNDLKEFLRNKEIKK